MKLERAMWNTATDLWCDIEESVRRSDSIELAAGILTQALFRRFAESVVLARLFATLPHVAAPDEVRAFAESLAAQAGVPTPLEPATPLLALAATHGVMREWCDRRTSLGHVAIPLLSAAYIAGIPMISALLRELGVGLDDAPGAGVGLHVEAIGQTTGLFFVEQAAGAVDAEGRKVIAAQDFVAEHGVQSVFGIGGTWPDGRLMVLILFCRDRLDRSAAERFTNLAPLFCTCTNRLSAAGEVFAGE